ncbi:hypothetical protein COH97_06585 [Neisseria meningitidis]|nr:hypothetical protein COH97_06585 [Neisseria meningitidis]
MAFCHCPDKLLNYLNYFDRRYTHMQDPEQSSNPARRFLCVPSVQAA